MSEEKDPKQKTGPACQHRSCPPDHCEKEDPKAPDTLGSTEGPGEPEGPGGGSTEGPGKGGDEGGGN